MGCIDKRQSLVNKDGTDGENRNWEKVWGKKSIQQKLQGLSWEKVEVILNGLKKTYL